MVIQQVLLVAAAEYDDAKCRGEKGGEKELAERKKTATKKQKDV
jgi:hypothetical protein